MSRSRNAGFCGTAFANYLANANSILIVVRDLTAKRLCKTTKTSLQTPFFKTEQMTNNLFNEIGGAEVVADIVDDFYDRVVADPDLKKFFEHTSIDRIKSMQRQFFGIAIGAPLEYSGRSLGEIHKGKHIKRDHISKFTDHLMDALSEIGISESDANRFVSRIAMYADEVLGETTVDG